ncbi:hypothetical protein QJQ45_030524, partial [Haematococcus lacustris]
DTSVTVNVAAARIGIEGGREEGGKATEMLPRLLGIEIASCGTGRAARGVDAEAHKRDDGAGPRHKASGRRRSRSHSRSSSEGSGKAVAAGEEGSGRAASDRPFTAEELAKLRLDLAERLAADEVARRVDTLVEERVAAALGSDEVRRELAQRLDRERRLLEEQVEAELVAERQRIARDVDAARTAIAAKEQELAELEAAQEQAEQVAAKQREEAEARALEVRLAELEARQATARQEQERRRREEASRRKEQQRILGKGRVKLSFSLGNFDIARWRSRRSSLQCPAAPMSQPANGHVASHAEETRADEQACQAAGESRLSTSYIVTCLLGYSLSFVIFGSQVSILGPTVNPLALKLGVSEADLSPLFTALGVSCIASGPPSGWLVDRMPTHRVLVGALLVQASGAQQALGFGLVPLMPGVWSLTALYALICFSYNFTNSAVFTSLGWMFPKRTASALNLVLAMFGVGSFCIPLAAQACKQLVGDPLAVFWVVSAMSLVATLPFLCVASPAPPPP